MYGRRGTMQEIDIRIQELDKTVCDNIELIDFASRGWFHKMFCHNQDIWWNILL